jgi:hypothetical protein
VLANVALVNTLTVNHPMGNERDAERYVARLRQVPTRVWRSVRARVPIRAPSR